MPRLRQVTQWQWWHRLGRLQLRGRFLLPTRRSRRPRPSRASGHFLRQRLAEEILCFRNFRSSGRLRIQTSWWSAGQSDPLRFHPLNLAKTHNLANRVNGFCGTFGCMVVVANTNQQAARPQEPCLPTLDCSRHSESMMSHLRSHPRTFSCPNESKTSLHPLLRCLTRSRPTYFQPPGPRRKPTSVPCVPLSGIPSGH